MRVFETCHDAGDVIRLHRHQEAYVAVVLDGAYEECSVDGTWLCEPGDLVVHPRWHLHTDRFSDRRTRVLNVLAPVAVAPGVFRTRRPASPRDLAALPELLRDAEPKPPKPSSSSLLRFMQTLRDERVSAAAARAGISREHASRSYRRHFGLAPRTARGEMQLRLALKLLTTTTLPLAQVALEAGFCDQAHFTRRIHAATGQTPRSIRQSA
jgi:AraC-like DNA-binding protein